LESNHRNEVYLNESMTNTRMSDIESAEGGKNAIEGTANEKGQRPRMDALGGNLLSNRFV
jgi:hypothetical protein